MTSQEAPNQPGHQPKADHDDEGAPSTTDTVDHAHTALDHEPRRRRPVRGVLVAAGLALAVIPLAAAARPSTASASGLGQKSGLLPRSHLTLESAIQVDLTHESVRLPLYKGRVGTETVWFVLLDASDEGLADDLGVNFAPKLANMAIGCATCVQTVTLDAPTAAANHFGQAVVSFQAAPDFSPTRVATPGPNGFPLADFQPGAVAPDNYSPFIRIDGSSVVYSAPIVAVGDGPFDVTNHSNTADRALGIHIADPAPDGQYDDSWIDMLFIKGFDAGKPIVYMSTDAGQPLTAVLERATYVPALDKAPYNGGDDFLGSARERLFGFVNGQTGTTNRQAQGFSHLALDGGIADDANADNVGLIDALRNGGDLLNVFGDFPTLSDPRHANAYSPLWDAQLSMWTDKAISEHRNTRQTDENQILNLAATRPDLLTGVDPVTGAPAPFGSAGVDINCVVIGFTAGAPTTNLAKPVEHGQFPPL